MRYLVTVLLAVLALAACNNRVEKGGTPPPVKASKFAKIQSTILQPKCVSCHAGTAGHVNLTSHRTIMEGNLVIPAKPESSRLYLSIVNGSMPKGSSPLSKEDIALVGEWIAQGAHELDPQSGEPPVVNPNGPKATYQWIAKNVFQTKCIVCHNAQKPRGKVDLSSYQGLMNSPGKDGKKPVVLDEPAKSTILIEIDEQKMPPNIPKLDDAQIAAVRDWINAGAPNGPPPPTPTPNPNPTPDPVEPTYTYLQKNVFSRRCGSCHGIPFVVANVDFTSYATLMNSDGKMMKPILPGDAAHSGIFQEIITGHMPPARKLVTPEERAVILEWIKAGAPNNG